MTRPARPRSEATRYARDVASNESPVPRDGRRARGDRTRLRVLDALLHLVEEGELRPTAQQVAQRAGVALRTVYHHFEDVEALRSMALDLQLERHVETLRPVKADLPLEERINVLARQTRRLFEAITPIRRATLFDENASLEMAEGLRRARSVRRAHLATTFAPELAKHNDQSRSILDAADVETSWQTWYYLRQALGRSAPAAERVVVLELTALFGPAAARS